MEHIGERYCNRFGSWYTVMEKLPKRYYVILFDNGYSCKKRYDHIKDGEVSCPYDKTMYRQCCIGVGDYKVWENGKHTKEYSYYKAIITRCFDEKYKEKEKTYKDVCLCEEWYNFQNFAKWLNENWYEIDNQLMCVDKDILIKGNKIYSPQTCILVPKSINSLFVSGKTYRGKNPIGVYENKDGKFIASCGNGKNEQIYLGIYNTSSEAFEVYKEYKEKIIKQVADEYKNLIPQKLYDAMYRYEVEIDD